MVSVFLPNRALIQNLDFSNSSVCGEAAGESWPDGRPISGQPEGGALFSFNSEPRSWEVCRAPPDPGGRFPEALRSGRWHPV